MPRSVPKMSAADVQHAVRELQAWGDGQRSAKLSWRLIEKITGFSRQSLSAKPDIAKAFDAAKRSLRAGRPPRRPRADDYLEQKLDSLKAQLKQYEQYEAENLERWARIAYHCRGKGFSIDDLDKPLPPVQRK